jgi:hypothetical protein
MFDSMAFIILKSIRWLDILPQKFDFCPGESISIYVVRFPSNWIEFLPHNENFKCLDISSLIMLR